MISEIWDKVTPINKVEPKRFCEIKGFSMDDEIYLIREFEGGRVMYVENQITTPFPDLALEERGPAHIEMLEELAAANVEPEPGMSEFEIALQEVIDE